MENSKLKGSFVKMLKGSKEANWGLLMFKPSDSSETIIVYATNNVPNLYVNYEVELSENSKYKNNRKLVSYIPVFDKKEFDWVSYFVKHIEGIGKTTAQKIIDNFGTDIFEFVLDLQKNEDKLKSILSSKQILSIQNYYLKNKDIIISLLSMEKNNEDDINFFYTNNLQKFYEKLLSKFGNKESFVNKYKTKSPYSLYLEYDFSIKEVDSFALLLGWDPNSTVRFEAFVDYLLIEEENNNSTLILASTISSKISAYFSLSIDEIIENFKYLIEHNKLFLTQKNKKNYLTRKKTYWREKEIVQALFKLNHAKKLELDYKTSKEFNNLSNEQKQAFYNFLTNNITIVSGGPGTGKSHLIKFINNTLKQNNLQNEKDYYILAPTGRAATNISLKTGESCRTIHSLLKIESDEKNISADLKDLEKIKVLIVDEFSMVNLNIFHKLLINCSNLQKLILIGDVEQLPAIGPGNLLAELIENEIGETTYLIKNFRSEYPEIIEHFNLIKNESIPIFKDGVVELLSIPKKYYLEGIVNEYLNQISIHGIENVILLSTSYKGDFGLISLNDAIQKKINSKGKLVYSSKILSYDIDYRVGDRVIQLENRISDDIYNGDLGVIKDKITIDKKNIILVQFKRGNNLIEIKYTEPEFREQINLAYGITVHKFQGSEINNVIFVLNPSVLFMLTKKMMYTATSRAIKKLTIMSEETTSYTDVLIQNYSKKEEILTNLGEFFKELKWS